MLWRALKTICESGEYKNILILLTPQLGTQAKETAEVIVKLYKEYNGINIFTSFIGGNAVQPGIDVLRENNIINFDYPVDAISILGLLFNKGNKDENNNDNNMDIEIENKSINMEIKNEIIKSKKEGLLSLPQNIVNKIMDFYHIPYPKSGNFEDKKLALDFCKKIFPHPVVLKYFRIRWY